jgi:hypothetical protein
MGALAAYHRRFARGSGAFAPIQGRWQQLTRIFPRCLPRAALQPRRRPRCSWRAGDMLGQSWLQPDRETLPIALWLNLLLTCNA